MKPAKEWSTELGQMPCAGDVQLVQGRGGEPTIKAGDVFLHSRYRPREEAARLLDSADLDPARPVLVVGLGLGYHVLELASRGMTVAAIEPDPGVAALALDGPMRESTVPLGVGDADAVAASEDFQAFAGQRPQVLIHPATQRRYPGYAEAVRNHLAKAGLAGQRLGVAVVGPLYGGSLPIAGYLVRAFQRLGHRTLFVDNSAAWGLYEAFTESVKSQKASGQLSGLLVNFLAEWTYARVAEFAPEFCIVMAQAPVGPRFPERLAKHNIISAYWFVENWRHMTYWREIAPLYDYFFHIQPGDFECQLTEAGCPRHAFVQTGCDPEVHAPATLSDDERREFSCDLSFAGAGYHNRNQLLAGLTDYDFKLWGVEWTARDLLPLVQHPDQRFTTERFTKIVAGSKINLNLHSSATHSGVDPRCDAINPRVFEIAACGGFQLCDPCKGLESHFDFERELPVYRDLPELRKQIDYYLAHPDERATVATNARERALRDHTYDRRAQQMLDLLLDAYGGRVLNKGIRVQRSIGETRERVGADTELGRYLETLPQDAFFTPEEMNKHIPLMGKRLSHPEAIFAYLREMRSSNEALLAEAD